MTSVTDEQLLEHAERIRGKVMLITGGASGIGKATALLYAKHGAKVVIGDIDTAAAASAVDQIIQAGGKAVCRKCDVSVWDDQVALFDLAVKTYGEVDVVIPNAGIVNGAVPTAPLEVVNGKLVRPDHKIFDINISAVVDTCALAFHYIPAGDPAHPDPKRLKALVLVGSMASYTPFYTSPQYTASKHAILGLTAGLTYACEARDIRLGSVHPWFVATRMTTGPIGEFIAAAEFPYTPVERVAATMLCVATHPDKSTSGLPWTLPDGGLVLRLAAIGLNEGVYAGLNARSKDAVQATERAFLAEIPKAKL